MRIAGLQEVPLLGILRGITKEQLLPVCEASYRAGLRTIEITLNTDNALSLIEIAKTQFGHTLTIGAGTVLTKDMASDAIQAGASFLVAPQCNPEVANYCQSKQIPYIPGALTPTEVYTAWEASKCMVKLFPASVFRASYIKTLKEPYNDIQIMAVGGVTKENIQEYFSCGASAVAFGASVYKKELLQKGAWDEIETAVKALVDATRKANG